MMIENDITEGAKSSAMVWQKTDEWLATKFIKYSKLTHITGFY